MLQPSGVIPNTLSSSSFIQLHCTKRQRCRRFCKCACHHPKNIRSTKFLESLVGSLLIGYTGLPILQSANMTSCQNCSVSTANIIYTFPSWLCGVMVYSAVRLWQKSGPELLLRCMRIRSFSSPCFQAIVRVDKDHVIRLLTEGKASILDVDENGRSILYHAIGVG